MQWKAEIDFCGEHSDYGTHEIEYPFFTLKKEKIISFFFYYYQIKNPWISHWIFYESMQEIV